jgi:hypothetical protein
MVIVICSSLALSGMGNNPLVSDQPDTEGTCNECQSPMTDEEIAEYEAALGRPPAPDRWI